MAFWNRPKQPTNRITSEALANYGRWSFLHEESGLTFDQAQGLIAPLQELFFTFTPTDRAAVIAELGRHADQGEWEKVGAWKFAREFLDDDANTHHLIQEGLLALDRMQITNLSIHLSSNDTDIYEGVTGRKPAHDGFFGPPVFGTSYGPTRQFYFDGAISAAASRVPPQVPAQQGAAPGDISAALSSLADLGALIHRGPKVVPPDIAIESTVIASAVAAATNVDHALFLEEVARAAVDPARANYFNGWLGLGAARFAEESLDPSVLGSPALEQLTDLGVRELLARGMFDVVVPVEILTPYAHTRLLALQGAAE